MLFSLMTRLMLNCVVIAIIAGIILLTKKLLKNHLTGDAHYKIWYLLFFVLIFPFLPSSMILAGHGLGLFGRFGDGISPVESAVSAASYGAGVSGFIEDFPISVSRRAVLHFPSFLPYIWGLGIVVMSILNIISGFKIRQITRASLPLQNRQIRQLFDSCLRELGMKKNIPVYSSAYLNSPIAAGFIKPVIIIPIHILSELTEKEIRYIFLHELSHVKHGDLFINWLMALAQTLYWYHPAVWLGLKEMRKDQEVACDLSVLSILEVNSYLDYGRTLISFAENMSRRLSPAAQIAGSEKEIRRRILCIAAYRKESVWVRWKSRFILAISALLLFAFMPVTSAAASGGSFYPFHPKHVNQLDLDSYFHGYEGSFVLYGVNSNQYYIYNQEEAATRISPDSTYKIYSALCALEHGIITPASTYIKWDKTPYPYEAWNKDQTLDTAMNHSVNWYFKALDEKNGISALKDCFKLLEYGNQDLTGGLDIYWLESSLKISPAEQVELLTRLSQGTLPFKPDHIKAVEDSIYLSSSQGVSLYGKTGTGTIDGQNINGWFIGFAKSSGETYVFSANIHNGSSANGRTAAAITLDILNDRNIYKQ